MNSEDQTYFAKRATEELVRAAACENENVARVHLNMAEHYKKRVSEIAGRAEQRT